MPGPDARKPKARIVQRSDSRSNLRARTRPAVRKAASVHQLPETSACCILRLPRSPRGCPISTMQDRIEKSVELNAPVSRVWRALTDHEEFGTWFRARLDGPFAVGRVTRGTITYPGYEHMKWWAQVAVLEPEHRFAFTWCPYSDDPDAEPDSTPHTRVDFVLKETATGCHLTVSESGFSALPDDARRAEAIRMNTQGWEEQVKNIAAHLGV